MKNTIYHFTGHIKYYHRHYLFGIFGGFAVFKLFLLLMGITFVQYISIHTKTFAELAIGCSMTGQYMTGQYQEWCVEIPESLTGGYFIDCETISWYRTGGMYDEAGNLVDQVWIAEETETWCVLTWQTIVPAYITWCYMTWWYMTWWRIICDEEVANDETIPDWAKWGDSVDKIWEEIEEESTINNGICESDDILWNAPLSWSVVRDIFSFDWEYTGSDCLISWLALQLLDHNDQWIAVEEIASWAMSAEFDSKKVYSFQSSGLYHIIGTNFSGENYYLYTGTYTWTYSRFFTWYMVRLIDKDLNTLHEHWPFTIDNELPTLTDVVLTRDGLTTWYLWKSGVVVLSFTASEVLSGVTVSLWSGKTPTDSVVSDDFVHTYTWNLNPLYPEWVLVANIAFADEAGNTWALVYTSALVFDMTAPTATGFVFTGTASWVQLNFTTSELTRVDFEYWRNDVMIRWMVSEYLSAHRLNFSTLEEDQLYTFSLKLFDQANNSRGVTGDFITTGSGDIISHVYIVPLVGAEELSGEVATLATVLKKEVEKYSLCRDAIMYTPVELQIRRNTFTLQMPDFQKSQVKVLVNAFTLFVLDQVKNNYTITTTDIDEITKKFNNFLIILKLLRDDDNTCKQNLSNYHIGQFTNVLEEFDIALE